MQLAWKIAAGIAAMFLIIRLFQYVKHVRTSIKRLKVAETRIKAETAEIRQMSVEKAWPLAKQVLEEKACLESWGGPLPANVNLVLEKLDGSVQSLFRAHRRCSFPQTNTRFDAEFLLDRLGPAMEDAYLIGSDISNEHKLITKPGSPVIFELNEDDRVIEEYPSIHHYILLAERE